MAKKEKNLYPKPVETLTHKDRRVNIPTEELRDFVADQEAKPKAVLYPRDPSLDPQLVWKGKDKQDREGLAVPAVPICIQEKIQPKTISRTIKFSFNLPVLDTQTRPKGQQRTVLGRLSAMRHTYYAVQMMEVT